MEVKDVAELLNTVRQEVLGESVVVTEDLSNVAQLGTEIKNAKLESEFLKGVVDKVSYTKFVSRRYESRYPTLMMSNWEYGSVLEKIDSDMPIVRENEAWQLTDGASYDQQVYHAPNNVTAKYYNGIVTFVIEESITLYQFNSSFQSGAKMLAFLSMLETKIDNALTIAVDNLASRTVNNMIAIVAHQADEAGTAAGRTSITYRNALYEYNQEHGTELTVNQFLNSADALRWFASEYLKNADHMGTMSTLFNAEGKERFTPSNLLQSFLLSEVSDKIDTVARATTFHDEFIKLPKHQLVDYWQGSGDNFKFENTSKIMVKTSKNDTVSLSGIIGVQFDFEACGLTKYERRVNTVPNYVGDFVTSIYKQDAGYMIDLSENCVVWYLA